MAPNRNRLKDPRERGDQFNRTMRTMDELVGVNREGHIVVGGYELTPQGLIVNYANQKDCELVGTLLFQLDESVQLLIGDWLVESERVYGQTYEKAAEIFNRTPGTLYNYKYVAQNVEFSLRNENLTYSHYAAVAHLPYERKQELLQCAVEGSWSVSRLRQEISGNHSPTLPASPLADTKNKRVFNRIWRTLSGGVGEVKREDVQHLRRWLDEVERNL